MSQRFLSSGRQLGAVVSVVMGGGGDDTAELIDGDSPPLREQKMLACLLWDGLTEQVSQRSDALP